jgi:hypothetical protein
MTFSAHSGRADRARRISVQRGRHSGHVRLYVKESAHWVANFFLNPAFRAKFQAPMDAYAYNLLRRAQFAFVEHALARTAMVAS